MKTPARIARRSDGWRDGSKRLKPRRTLVLETLEPRVMMDAAPEVAVEHAAAAAAAQHSATNDLPAAAPVGWTGGDGAWETAANWSTGNVPTAGDTVTIPSGVTVTINSAVAVDSLTSAGNLVVAPGRTLTLSTASSISGDFTINGDITTGGTLSLSGTTTWNNGQLGGSGTFANSGSFTKTQFNLSLLTNLTNTGTLNLGEGQLFIDTGKSVTNQAGGTLNLSSTFSNGGLGTINNAGTLNSTDTPTIGGVLNNTGTVNVNDGTLTLRNGGSSSGIMDVDAGATLQWLNGTGTGTFLLQAGAQVQGAGRYLVTGFGDVAVAAGYSVAFTHLQIDPFSLVGGAGDVVIPSGSTLTWEGGSFYGTGKTIIEAGATANARDVSFGQSLEAHVMDVYGVLNLNSTALLIHDASTLNIMPGGVLNLNGTGQAFGPAESALNILGTLNANADAGKSVSINGVTATLNGTAHSTSGNFAITSPLTLNGTMIADAGAGISFNGFTVNYTINPGAALQGAGHYYVNSGTKLTIPAGMTLSLPDLQVNGTIAGAGTLTVPAGGTLSFLAQGATMEGPGVTNVEVGGTIKVGGDGPANALGWGVGRPLNNAGSIIVNGSISNLDPVTINNQAGALIDFVGTSADGNTNFSARFVVNNSGTIRFGGNIADVFFDGTINNHGLIESVGDTTRMIRVSRFNVSTTGVSDGEFRIAANTTMEFGVAHNFTAGAQWTGAGLFQFFTGTFDFAAGVTFNPARVNFLNGTFTGAGAMAIPAGATWTGTAPNFQLASFSIGSGATFDVSFSAAFTNTAVTNQGLVKVTGTEGRLRLQGTTTFNNAVGAEVLFSGITTIGGFQDSFSSATFTNNGTVRVINHTGEFSSGLATVSMPGTFEIHGGTARLILTLGVVSEDGTQLTGGTWRILDGADVTLTGIETQDFFGNPLVRVVENQADVTISGPGAHFNALDNLALNTGTLAVLDGATLDIHAYVVDPGEVNPNGPIPGPLTNNGTLEIGEAAVVAVGTIYTQGATGTLRVRIGNSPENSGAGRLQVAQNAALAGTLAVQLDGFTPDLDDQFVFASFASRTGNFSAFNGVQPLFLPIAGTTEYRLAATGALANLVSQNVIAATSGVVGSSVQVTYSVLNDSDEATAATAWTDSIYFSPTASFDASTATLLGRVDHQGALAGHASYDGALSATLPAAAPGDGYIVVVTDSRDQVAETSGIDNAAATAAFTVSVPALTLGSASTGTLAGGQRLLFRVTVPAGVTGITISTSGTPGAAELLIRKGAPPKADGLDAYAFDPSSEDQSIVLTEPGEYFVEVRGTALAGAGVAFSLLAQPLAFALDESSPNAATNNGEVTLRLQGAQFTTDTVFRLVPASGSAIEPSKVIVQDAATAFVTFNLNGVTPGAFDITASDGVSQSVLDDAFTVLPAPAVSTGASVFVTISGPRGFRLDRPAPVLVTWRNATNTDLPAPLLIVKVENASLLLPGDVADVHDYIVFLGTNHEGGDPGVLPPGFIGTQFINLLPEVTDPGIQITYSVSEVDSRAAVDYNEVSRLLKPATVSDADWAPVLAQLQNQLGPTYGDYARKLAADVKLLTEDDHHAVVEPVDLLALELEDAFAATGTSLRGTTAGVAIGGHTVTAVNQTTGEVFTTTARKDGSYVFGRVTAGDYVLTVEGAAVASGANVSVVEGAHVAGVALALAAGTQLGGIITAPGGAPIVEARIDVTDAAGRLYRTFTDATGSYSFAGLSAGPYTVVIHAEGRARTVLENVAGATASAVLGAEGVLSGTVDLEAGGPLDGTLLITAKKQGGGANFIFSTSSDTAGYTLRGLSPGVYDITFSRDGYVRTTIQGVAVSAGGATDLSPSLQVSSTVSGTVTSQTPGVLAAGIQVIATSGNTVVAVASTDANGAYTLDGLAPGDYQIAVLNPSTFSTPVPVHIDAPGAMTGIDFTLEAGGSIAGDVTLAGGDPLAGFTVIAVDANGRVFEAGTDANGRYNLSALPVGTYRVSVRSADATSQLIEITQLTGSTVEADLQVTAAAQITGQLRLDNGMPATGGRVLLLRAGEIVGSTVADASGNYRFLLFETGTFDLQAVATGASFIPVTGVVAGAGATVTQDLVAGTGVLQIDVSDAFDGTTGDVLFVRQDSTGEIVATITLGEAGTATVSNLAPGVYNVIVDGTGRSAAMNATVTGGSTTPVSLVEAQAGSLSGFVSATGGGDSSGGGFVALYPAGGGSANIAPIDENGFFEFPTLAPGTYSAVAIRNGYVAQTLPNVTVAAGENVEFNITTSTSFITGRVKDKNGAPIANASVVVYDSMNHIVGVDETGSDGRFSIAVQGTDLKVSITPPDNPISDLPELFDVADGETTDVGDVTYAFVSTGLQINPTIPVPGMKLASIDIGARISPEVQQPNGGDPAAILRALNERAFKSELHVEPPMNECEERCRPEYNAAVQAIRTADLAFDAVKEAQEALNNEARDALLTFASEVLPLFNAAAAAILLLPPAAAAVETAGAGLLLSGAVAGLVDAINSYNNFLGQSEPADAADTLLALGGFANGAADGFGNVIKVLDKSFYSASTGVFSKFGPIGVAISSISIVKKSLTGGLFEMTESRLRTLAQLYDNYESAKKQYGEALTEAYGKIEDYERCKRNENASGDSPDCKRPPEPPQKMPPNSHSGQTGRSFDPNDIDGPAGFGPQNFVGTQAPLPYTIHFENVATASAAAAEVKVTQTLDGDLDLSTFQLTGFGFGGQTFTIPEGRSNYHTQLDLRETKGILLDIDAELDLQSGVLTWTFTSIDPLTGDVPGDTSLGFLPPNMTGPEGEGFVSYTVQPKANAATGTIIDAQASIVFDTNTPILTPSISNTIDAGVPNATVNPLPAQSGSDFTLSWSGTDDANGSGIVSYDVFLSDNGGAFTPLLTGTTHTAAVINGELGHTYAFVVLARDGAGNVEAAPAVADATVTIVATTELTLTSGTPLRFADADGDMVTVKLTGPGSGVVRLVNGVATGADLRALTLSGTTQKSALSISVEKGGATSIGRMFADTDLASLTLGKGVTLGDGFDEGVDDVSLGTIAKSIKVGSIADFAVVRFFGEGTLTNGKVAAPSLTTGEIGTNAAITSKSGFGAVKIASWANGGFFGAAQSVKSFTVAGDLSATVDLDSAGDNSGTANLGALTVGGALRNGNVSVEGKLGNVKAAGITLETISAAGIGNITSVLKKQTGTAAAISLATITSSLGIGKITASISGLASLNNGRAVEDSLFTAGASIGAIHATAKAAGGATGNVTSILNARFFAESNIGKFTADGVATTEQVAGLTLYAGGKISGVTITSKNATLGVLRDSLIFAGQTATLAKNGDLAKASLGSLSVTGSVFGSLAIAAGNLGKVSIGGDAVESSFVAGMDVGDDTEFLTADDTWNGHGSIASLSVKGAFTRSTAAAGIDAGIDRIFGTADDTTAQALSGLTAAAKIGSIKLGAATVAPGTSTPLAGPAVLDHSDAIEAPLLAGIKISGRPVFKDFASPVWIDADGEGDEDADEIVVRKL